MVIMRTELLEVAGFIPAILSARAAMKSYDKMDSTKDAIGEQDQRLIQRLINDGGPHCKCIRQIQAWFSVDAPRYWWQEFDTYMVGVSKGSESTMHKIMSRPLTIDDFDGDSVSQNLIDLLNDVIKDYHACKEGAVKTGLLVSLKQMLPEGFLQKRFVNASYQALRNMYRWRQKHRLPHWNLFCNFLETLPESWIITMPGGNNI